MTFGGSFQPRPFYDSGKKIQTEQKLSEGSNAHEILQHKTKFWSVYPVLLQQLQQKLDADTTYLSLD